MTVRRRRFWLRLAFVLAILATTVFGLRAIWFAWELSERAEKPVAGWMTPRYILAVYDVDPQALAAILHVDPEATAESVARLAAASGRSTAEVLDDIAALIKADRATE